MIDITEEDVVTRMRADVDILPTAPIVAKVTSVSVSRVLSYVNNANKRLVIIITFIARDND